VARKASVKFVPLPELLNPEERKGSNKSKGDFVWKEETNLRI
jgi:hypothetical protein